MAQNISKLALSIGSLEGWLPPHHLVMGRNRKVAQSPLIQIEGDLQSDLMFVGVDIGPDAKEIRAQLEQMIHKMGASLDRVMIANILKTAVLNPRKLDAEVFRPLLMEKIKSLKPKVIVALGEAVTKVFIQTEEGIVALRGRSFQFEGALLVPTFHPGYVFGKPAALAGSLQDLAIAAKILGFFPSTD